MLSLDAKSYLIRQGDAPSSAFLIETGSMEIVRDSSEGEVVLAVVGPGEIVGDMAIIDRSPPTASVRAREACRVLPITADQIEKRLASADPILRLVLGVLLDRLQATLAVMRGGPQSPPPGILDKDAAVLAAALTALRLEQDLERALAQGEVQMHFQPIVRLASGRLTGFEALARWRHPTRGPIPPSVFIPVAEAGGFSDAIARIGMAQIADELPAMLRAAQANRDNVESIHVNLNISGQDLADPHFLPALCAIALDRNLPAGAINLELTESAFVRNQSEAARALDAARRLGFGIALDDFGTGYSALSTIHNLPFDCLKIDRSFVCGLGESSTSRDIVAGMRHLSASLGLCVVAEGVERAEEAAILDGIGCEFGQGYMFGRPRDASETLGVVERWDAAEVAGAYSSTPIELAVA